MPVTVQWHDAEHTILRYEFSGRWTWDEVFRAYQRAGVLCASVQHTVYGILLATDDEATRAYPTKGLTTMHRMSQHIPANAGLAVIVFADNAPMRALMQTLHHTMTRISPGYALRVKLAASLEQAESQIARRKVSLKDTAPLS
jgi:hypothetical protein